MCLYVTCGCPKPLSPALSTYSAMKSPEHSRGLLSLNQHMKEISKWNNAFISCTARLYEH
jgi:hypothetical protein